MRKPRMLKGILLCVVAGIVSAGIAGCRKEPAPVERPVKIRYEQLLPRDTLVFYSVEDLAESRKKAEGTAWHDIMQEPSIKEFLEQINEFFEPVMAAALEPMLEQLIALGEKIEASGGMPELSFDGQFVFAITDLDAEALMPPRILMAADLDPETQSIEEVDRALGNLLDTVSESFEEFPKRESYSHNTGTTVYTFDATVTTICYALPGNRLVVTSSKDGMDRFLDDLASRPRRSLATSSVFRQMKRRVGPRPESFLLVNVDRAFEIIKDNVGSDDAAEFGRFLEVSGLAATEAFAVGSTTEGKGVKTIQRVKTAGGSPGLFKLLTPAKGFPKTLRYLPANCLTASAYRLSLADIWPELLTLLQESGEADPAEIDSVIAEFESSVGVDLEEGILPLVAGELAVAIAPPPAGMMLPVPQVTIVAETGDPTNAATTLNTLLSKLDVSLAESDFGGHTIHSITIPGAPMMPVTPSYTLHGNYLIMASSPQALKELVMTIDEDRIMLSESPVLQESLTHVPKPTVYFGYSDTAALVQTFYNTALPILQMQQQSIPINLASVPPAEAITKHLFPGVTSGTVDNDGITLTTYSSLSSNPLLGIAVGAAIGNLVQVPFLGTRGGAQPAAMRTECTNNLKQMGLVLKMYAHEHKGRFPAIDDRRGNLMVEGDEIFPEYLTDVNILCCPGKAPHTLIVPPWKADDVTDESYFYLGWAVTTEDEGLALLEAYESLDLSERDADIEVREGKGNVGGKVVFRLREGIERFFITDINQPEAPPDLQSKIPLIWDRLGNHMPDGGNVLYMDGHVEFVKYPGKFPMTERFMTALEALADSG